MGTLSSEFLIECANVTTNEKIKNLNIIVDMNPIICLSKFLGYAPKNKGTGTIQ